MNIDPKNEKNDQLILIILRWVYSGRYFAIIGAFMLSLAMIFGKGSVPRYYSLFTLSLAGDRYTSQSQSGILSQRINDLLADPGYMKTFLSVLTAKKIFSDNMAASELDIHEMSVMQTSISNEVRNKSVQRIVDFKESGYPSNFHVEFRLPFKGFDIDSYDSVVKAFNTIIEQNNKTLQESLGADSLSGNNDDGKEMSAYETELANSRIEIERAKMNALVKASSILSRLKKLAPNKVGDQKLDYSILSRNQFYGPDKIDIDLLTRAEISGISPDSAFEQLAVQINIVVGELLNLRVMSEKQAQEVLNEIAIASAELWQQFSRHEADSMAISVYYRDRSKVRVSQKLAKLKREFLLPTFAYNQNHDSMNVKPPSNSLNLNIRKGFAIQLLASAVAGFFGGLAIFCLYDTWKKVREPNQGKK